MRQLNKVNTIISRLTVHGNIFFSTYPVVVFSHLLCSLFFLAQEVNNVSPLQPLDGLAILKTSAITGRIVKRHLLAANGPVFDVVMHSNKITGP